MAGPGGKAIRYSLRQSFMRWSIRPGTFSFARFDGGASVSVGGERSVPLLAFVLGYSRFHQFLDKCHGQRFVCWELDGSFGCRERFEFIFELFDNRSCGKQTAMV